jgi:ABC-type branched-subunit amino acid transport system ATPase component
VTSEQGNEETLGASGSQDALLRAGETTTEFDRTHLQAVGRAGLGIAGRSERPRTSEVPRAAGPSWWPAVTLGALGALTISAPIVAQLVLADEMSSVLGIGSPWRNSLLARVAGAVVAVLVVGLIASHARNRARIAALGGLACAAVAVGQGFVVGGWIIGPALSLALLAFAGGFLAIVVQALVWPLLFDIYPPARRVRAFAIGGAATTLGLAAVPAIAALDGNVLGLTWRVTFLALAGCTLVASVAALAVGDPGKERWDGEIARAIRADASADDAPDDSEGPVAARLDLDVSTTRILRRVAGQTTGVALLSVGVCVGVFLIPVTDYLSLLWQERFDLSRVGQLDLYAGTCLAGLLGVAWFAWRGEPALADSLPRLLRLLLWAGCTAGAALALSAVSRPLAISGVFLAVAFGALAVLVPGAAVASLTIVLPRDRAYAAALFGASVVAGGMLMMQFLQSVGSRFGVVWALLIASLVIAGNTARLQRENQGPAEEATDRVVSEVIEEEEMRFLAERGVHLPLMACRNIDFSYGVLQVLFRANLTVDNGEMVALLGTNGAGKSTLLNVISGLGSPTRGSVYFEGRDITRCETDLRVRMGITQIAGGRAVFGPLTVVDNLRVFGYSLGRNGRAVDATVDRVFDAFPQLAGRRDQLASTLSGGERQMLALGKAYALNPKLLLIDELSLGLAPLIVAQLLDMVREINARGTSIVLVEQSVNVALSLADHAYFMERGEIRFDGRAAELLERPDLLRSVFLQAQARSPVTEGVSVPGRPA